MVVAHFKAKMLDAHGGRVSLRPWSWGASIALGMPFDIQLINDMIICILYTYIGIYISISKYIYI